MACTADPVYPSGRYRPFQICLSWMEPLFPGASGGNTNRWRHSGRSLGLLCQIGQSPDGGYVVTSINAREGRRRYNAMSDSHTSSSSFGATPSRVPDELEKLAREAVDLRAGRALTDTEWEHARARLMEFATILRSWQQDAQNKNSAAFLPKAA